MGGDDLSHFVLGAKNPTGRQLTATAKPSTSLKMPAMAPRFRTVAPMAFEVDEECSSDEMPQRQR